MFGPLNSGESRHLRRHLVADAVRRRIDMKSNGRVQRF
jgi:hypothetical protein